MPKYTVTLACWTTDGIGSVKTDPRPLGEAMDTAHGMIAAVGEENVISIQIGMAD